MWSVDGLEISHARRDFPIQIKLLSKKYQVNLLPVFIFILRNINTFTIVLKKPVGVDHKLCEWLNQVLSWRVSIKFTGPIDPSPLY